MTQIFRGLAFLLSSGLIMLVPVVGHGVLFYGRIAFASLLAGGALYCFGYDLSAMAGIPWPGRF